MLLFFCLAAFYSAALTTVLGILLLILVSVCHLAILHPESLSPGDRAKETMLVNALWKQRTWFRLAMQMHGSVVPAVLPRTILCGAFAALVLLLYYAGIPVGLSTSASILLNIFLGLLLVFRTMALLVLVMKRGRGGNWILDNWILDNSLPQQGFPLHPVLTILRSAMTPHTSDFGKDDGSGAL